ncbi:MAG: DUF134 domain-containing protein [Firmicutes bacterium]|jgi:predicted DNA-binding protein (UPF0251 family)|nr:DUF134 domain-containing protein [Bacillota bacterium]
MPRPPKFRRVELLPQVTVFKPAGVPLRELVEEVLTVEELEAIRLKDMEGLEQEQCAERMQVSRPTFQRVLVAARQKVARALVEGRAIRVEGGNYRLAVRRFQCRACNYEFEVPFGTGQRGIEMVCPQCNAQQVHRVDQNGHGFGNMPWGRHGRGWNRR